ncbi:MAG: nickel pincer cofactor biosynthesis protein LarC [Planctomycetota bacterium]|nr:nickel pincer cofactor biosynthesis protein LarC [Planctomycetota bacterium]
MKIAYFDCFAGAGGDMIAAAMLDAGLDFEFLKKQLATLGIKNFDIKLTQTKRAGLRAVSFTPAFKEDKHHRNLKDITEIISNSKIHNKAKETAIAIFNKLAAAEALVHNKDLQDIHFHEVGALDSIVDIVSASIGLVALEIEKVYCSTLSLGGGTIKCAHGILPVPGPATAELLKGVPTVGGPIDKELLTPTAAAILTTIVNQFGVLPEMKIEKIGYGAGSLESEKFPNVLRLIIGQSICENAANTDSVCLLEANSDDVTGEIVGFVTEKLFESNALDVFTTPIYMKHNRPAVKISVICTIEDVSQIEEILFTEGLTFGIRKQILHRSKLERDFAKVATEFGAIKIKTGSLNGRIVTAKPEFSDCAAAAKKHKVAVKTVIQTAIAEYKKTENSS